jgi:hypothetical protein
MCYKLNEVRKHVKWLTRDDVFVADTQYYMRYTEKGADNLA